MQLKDVSDVEQKKLIAIWYNKHMYVCDMFVTCTNFYMLGFVGKVMSSLHMA